MKKRKIGFILAIISAMLWGISGNITEYLFEISDIEPATLVISRMFASGIIFLAISLYKVGLDDLRELKNDKILKYKLVYYSIFSILTQLPFFITIKYSSAPFATLIQYITPIIIIFYGVVTRTIKPKKIEYVLTASTFLGVFLVLTNGKLGQLNVSLIAIFTGFLSAFGFAFYLIYANKIKNIDKISLCSFSMLISGIILIYFFKYNQFFNLLFNLKFFIFWVLNIVIGCVLPFYMFLKSLEYIPPRTTSLLGCFEPLTALVISILLFNSLFGVFQIIGVMLIIGSVMLLSR